MNEESRRAYRGFSTFFLVVGGVFLALGVARAMAFPDLLDGDPVPVALILMAIGAGLRWTVRDEGGGPE